MPPKKRSQSKKRSQWRSRSPDGPGLSLLAHLGMVVGVLVFTYAYLTAAV